MQVFGPEAKEAIAEARAKVVEVKERFGSAVHPAPVYPADIKDFLSAIEKLLTALEEADNKA